MWLYLFGAWWNRKFKSAPPVNSEIHMTYFISHTIYYHPNHFLNQLNSYWQIWAIIMFANIYEAKNIIWDFKRHNAFWHYFYIDIDFSKMVIEIVIYCIVLKLIKRGKWRTNCIRKKVAAIPSSMIRRVIESLVKRLETFVEIGGGHLNDVIFH